MAACPTRRSKSAKTSGTFCPKHHTRASRSRNYFHRSLCLKLSQLADSVKLLTGETAPDTVSTRVALNVNAAGLDVAYEEPENAESILEVLVQSIFQTNTQEFRHRKLISSDGCFSNKECLSRSMYLKLRQWPPALKNGVLSVD